jgi:HAD superfamily hydrolase (TIGR01549 family)
MPGRHRLSAVLFDWDGTLVDSAESTYRSYVKVFAAFGISFDRRRFAETYSPNWQETYRQVGLREEHWPAADREWLVHYGSETNALLPGVLSALARLSGAGFRLGLVTSGERHRVTTEMSSLGVAAFFHAVVCGDDLPHKKPRPEPLLLALDRLMVGAADAAYVGDSPEDVLMTRAAGAFAVAIPGGFPNHRALEASIPDARAESLDSAVRLLLEMRRPASALRSS